MTGENLVQRTGRGVAESVPHVGYLGASCWAMWVMLMYGGGLLAVTVEDASVLAQSYIISTVFLALTSIALGVMGSRAYRLFSRFRVMMAFGLMASVGTALDIAGASGSVPLMLHLGNVLTGTGTGCVAMSCAMQFAELPPRNSIIMTALMMACALAACSLFIGLPNEALMGVMVSLPTLAVAFSFIRPREEGLGTGSGAGADAGAGAGERTLSIRDVALAFGMFLLILLVFTASGLVPFSLHYEAFSIRNPSSVLTALAAMGGMVVVAALLSDETQFERLYYVVLVALLAFYLIVVVADIRTSHLALFFSSASILLNAIVWGFLSCLAHYAGRLSVTVFGFGRAVVSLGVTLGWLVGSYYLVVDQLEFFVALGIGLLAFVLVVSAMLFRQEGGARLPVMDDFDAMMARGDATPSASASVATPAGSAGADAGTAGAAGGARAMRADGGPANAGDVASIGENGGARADLTGTVGESGLAGGSGLVGGAVLGNVSRETFPGGAAEVPVIRPRWRLKMLLVAEEQGLTKREVDVFLLMAKGKDAQSIADELHVSLSTARTHVRSIYSKCDVHSRHEFQRFVEDEAARLSQQEER